MISIEAVDQTYFINVDDYYTIQDALNDEDKGISTLIFDSCTILDEKWKSIELKGLSEFSSLSEWKKFKSSLIEKFNAVEKYIMVYLDRASKIADGESEDDAKSYWNDSDDDSYPKDSFETFKEWYGSQSYYEWDADNRQISWDDFQKENNDIYNALDTEDYIDHYGNIYTRGMVRALEVVQKRINELLKEIDSDIALKINENKYEAVEYIFTY